MKNKNKMINSRESFFYLEGFPAIGLCHTRVSFTSLSAVHPQGHTAPLTRGKKLY